MPITEDERALIRKYAVKNAIDYGEARSENVFGKVVKSMPKEEIRELKDAVNKIVNEVNSLSKDQREKEYEEYEKEFEIQYEKRVEDTSKPKMMLEGATKVSFATRFAPEPSGYMHIGHASTAFLAQEFAKIYDGKLFLYFDDTNPEKEKQEFVDNMKKDLKWLGIEFDGEYYASDSIEKLYGYAKALIISGKAYACECIADQIKKNRFEMKECIHRNASGADNLNKFEMMIANKYDEEKVVIRFKGDMKSQNTALRDPNIMRIKKDPHYRQGTKYVVWPTYDFNTPINDSIHGITDGIRTKEYELRDVLYAMVLDALGLRKPRMHSHARLTIRGQPHQKREINRLIKDGVIKGYDDPRLVTITALRRRGILPEAIKKFVLGFGMSKMDTVVDIGPVLAETKKLVDPVSKRLYYVPAPVSIDVNSPPTEIEIKLHPSNELGSRRYTTTNIFYISGEDATGLKDDDVVELKGLFKVKIKKVNGRWVGDSKLVEDSIRGKLVQWVCEGNYLKCRILVPSNPLDNEGNFNKDSLRINEGYVESYASQLKEKEVVQFERFGFCVLDDKKLMQFIFIAK